MHLGRSFHSTEPLYLKLFCRMLLYLSSAVNSVLMMVTGRFGQVPFRPEKKDERFGQKIWTFRPNIYNSFTELDIIISRGNHRLNFVRSCVLRLESLSYLSLFHVLCRAVYVCVMGTKWRRLDETTSDYASGVKLLLTDCVNASCVKYFP